MVVNVKLWSLFPPVRQMLHSWLSLALSKCQEETDRDSVSQVTLNYSVSQVSTY